MQISWGWKDHRWFLLGVLFLFVNAYAVLHHGKTLRNVAGATAPASEATHEELSLTKLEPVLDSFEDGEIQAGFTAPLNVESAATFIEIDPKIEFHVEPWEGWDSEGCKIVAAFQPGAIYRVTFRQGLKAADGSTLRADIERVVSFPDRPASIAFRTSGQYLSSVGNMLVPVTTVNVRQFTATAERVYPNNLVYFTMRESDRYAHYYGDPFDKLTHEVGGKHYRVDAPPNQPIDTLLNLRELLREAPTGAFHITVTTDKGVQASHLVVVTDIGLTAKLSTHDLLVWANSIHTLAAVTGAEVRVYSKTNQELLHGTTDTNGLVRFETRFDEEPAEPFLITVSNGEELSYLKLDGTRVDLPGDTGGRPYLRHGYEAYLFTDRGIYRPGETAHVKAVVRDRDVSCPPSFPVHLHVLRPDGKRDQLLSAVLNEFGTAEFSIEWPDYAVTGNYRLQLKVPGQEESIGAASVAVEEFVPPQIAVRLDVPTSRTKADEPFTFRVDGQHLFGRPATGNAAWAGVEFVPEVFAYPDWPGYVFSDAEKKFVSVREELSRTTLDIDGKAQFTAKPSASWRPPSALKAIVVGSVMETGGRTVSAYGSHFVDAYPFYIGLKLASSSGTIMVGEPQEVSVVAVKPDGQADTAVTGLQLTLGKVSWSTALKKDASGRYSFQSERQLTVLTNQEVHLVDGRTTAAFTPREAGEFLLSVRDPASESSSSLDFYVGAPGQEWLAWSMESPDRVELALDKPGYAPGEQATLLIKAPFVGKALLTVESDHVLQQQVLTLEKNTAQVQIPVLPEFSPNVYCVVSLIRPVQAGEKWAGHRAIGSVPLMVRPADRRLTVALTAPKEIRPRQRLSVAVETTVATNEPVRAEIVVAAVDEGICALTDFVCPDPDAYFWAQRRLDVDWYDLYSLLMPEVQDAINGTPSDPGGDSNAVMLRKRLNPITARRFKPLALWACTVTSSNDGRAVVIFDVPEFTGQLRLMAVAIETQRFGAAQSSVLVKQPLVVRSSLPRFLASSDRCQMPVQVFNETGHDGEAEVKLSCSGPLGVDGSTSERLAIYSGESRTLDFTLAAQPRPGPAKVTLQVTMGAEQYTEEFEIAVRPAAGRVTLSGVGSVAPGRSAQVTFPSHWLAGTAQQELLCSGLPALQLGGGLDYLLRYPYGCIEQTTSASFPLLYLSDLAAQMQPGSMGHEEPAHFVQAGIRRILSMQLANGGFGQWPNAKEPYEWGSIYATHFLAEAGRAGYAVPKDRLELACEYLQGLLSKRVVSTEDLSLRAYACLALALAGKPEHGWMARLQEQRSLLTPGAQVDVAAALAAAGRRRDATAFLAGVETGSGKPATRVLGGCLSSSVRDQALLLSTWLELDPDNPTVPTLARRLESANVNGRWYTTQDNAVALSALGKYAQLLAQKKRPFAATVSWHDGKESFTFNGEKDVHLQPDGVVSLTNAGPGTVYYYWRSEGVSTDGQTEELDQGMSVYRRLLGLSGQPLQSSRLKQGELVVVELTLDTGGATLDNVAVEDLLPAGLEIENADLKTSELVSWLKDRPTLPVRHTELRDDRLLIFTDAFSGRQTFYYAARAVTAGDYVWPAITASCMYDPDTRSVNGKSRLQVE